MNRIRILLLGLSVLLILILAGGVWAKSPTSFTIDWRVMSGGGAPASGSGGVILNGSLGQTAIGPSVSTGGEYELEAGYWLGERPYPVPPDRYIYLPVVLRDF